MNVNILQSILLGHSGMLTGSVDQGAFGCFRSILVGYSQGCLVYRMVDGEACWRYVYCTWSPNDLYFEGQAPKSRPFPTKKRVIWVPGIYIYTFMFVSTVRSGSNDHAFILCDFFPKKRCADFTKERESWDCGEINIIHPWSARSD